MFSIRRLYGYIFLLSIFPVQILNCELFKSADELACLLLLILSSLDVYQNGLNALRRYKLTFIAISVLICYVIYSYYFCHFNTLSAIVSDFISQIKPFIVFFLTLGLGISLDQKTKDLLRIAALINVVVLVISFIFWFPDHELLGHPANFGCIMLLSSWAYLYGSISREGFISDKDKWVVLGILILGLFCTRSKYYGEFLFMLFLLFGYKPGMQRHISYKMILSFILVMTLVILVAWQKINYYFIQGTNDVFAAAADDTSLSENFARPVLYAVAGVLLVDFFPFGTGLASFASNASADSYSTLYYDYGVNVVHGLSPEYPSFICDAYYPSLAQFGLFGIGLFLYFWYWILCKLNRNESIYGASYRYSYILGIMVVAFVFIESIGSTFFTQGHGMFAMMLLALIITENQEYYGK